jgi:transposase-like protein
MVAAGIVGGASKKVKMALKMAMRKMSVLGIAETLEVKPSTASTWVDRAGMHCEKVGRKCTIG